jgi:hypothetical protein
VKAALADSALVDLRQIYAVYQSKPGRQGDKFLDLFDEALYRIAENVRGFSTVEDAPPNGEWRECYIQRFRQRVIFRVDGEIAAVVAVVYSDAPPKTWQPKLT